MTAGHAQTVQLPDQAIAETVIAELAGNILALQQRVKDLDTQIAAAFRTHAHAASIESMPGFGPILGAQLLVAAGDLRSYPTAGHLAAAAGLVPQSRTTPAAAPGTSTSPTATADPCVTPSSYQPRRR